MVDWQEVAATGGDTFDEISTVVDGLDGLLHAGKYAEVDDLYIKFDVTKMSTSIMMAMLRVPFVIKDQLKNWQPFLAKCREEFTRRGITSPLAFKGLIPTAEEIKNARNLPTGDYVHGVPYRLMRLKMLVCGKAAPSDEEWAEGLGKLLEHLQEFPLK